MKLQDEEISFLRLIERSDDIGDGWRQCSPILWNHFIQGFHHTELIELKENEKQVRLSERGKIVVEYL